jgi:two-component system response regulator CpxR
MAAAENSEKLSLLLVDDDAELCNMMKEFFAENGYRLETVHNGRDGLTRAVEGHYDLLILDVMLPTINGFTVLHQLRRRRDVPVIMLTARTGPQDRIQGLEAGADDYLPKPFDPDELLARVRAVLRRSGKLLVEDSPQVAGNLRISSQTREAWKDSQRLDLTSVEFDILDLLVRSAGRVLGRDEITAAILDREATPYDRSLDVHISHLRKKLEDGGNYIQTVRGVGYVFTRSRQGSA